ncbi:antibiotic biosynthesis monooxygenase [Thalassotalea sp. M1531]|uniref:Antibiotic biosynthesis monooxygenase n=1 Tax=Thalassotalea algicola TaxID=2716224 RepID=A0A7Y0LDA7_9GAMM|nr:antibiotic biosynthesis monooxygenase [Thalassotalea algicola]NMP31060.1 antibiotic biosynthesis monooxygenase [Thalassotalea algicola]
MTYAVIFRATINKLDKDYDDMVQQLRKLAFEQYNCQEFIAYSEGNEEIAVSYWQSLEDIANWKANTSHLYAQKLGGEKWYQAYRVQVTEILRDYQSK